MYVIVRWSKFMSRIIVKTLNLFYNIVNYWVQKGRFLGNKGYVFLKANWEYFSTKQQSSGSYVPMLDDGAVK